MKLIILILSCMCIELSANAADMCSLLFAAPAVRVHINRDGKSAPLLVPGEELIKEILYLVVAEVSESDVANARNEQLKTFMHLQGFPDFFSFHFVNLPEFKNNRKVLRHSVANFSMLRNNDSNRDRVAAVLSLPEMISYHEEVAAELGLSGFLLNPSFGRNKQSIDVDFQLDQDKVFINAETNEKFVVKSGEKITLTSFKFHFPNTVDALGVDYKYAAISPNHKRLFEEIGFEITGFSQTKDLYNFSLKRIP